VITRALALAGLATVIPVAALPLAAQAVFTSKDAQVLGRTLAFAGDGMSGPAVVGIVFAPTDPASQREAELVWSVIGDGLPTGRVTLQARLVPLDQLASASGLAALYVTPGLAEGMGAISAAAHRLHVPTISTDPACIQSDSCVVGFTSAPTVQITIDRVAADQAGVHFLQAFRMLVREK
jgi:hypothetical protein